MTITPIQQGGFLFVTDVQGHRHAIRLSAIASVCDADEEGSETTIALFGGRIAIRVRHGFNEIADELLPRLVL